MLSFFTSDAFDGTTFSAIYSLQRALAHVKIGYSERILERNLFVSFLFVSFLSNKMDGR